MDWARFIVDFILHVDVHLISFVQAYGAWVYALLFAIVFIETGVVVMPFLPGDSLLFVCGLTLAGYLFGNIPFVREHLDKIIWAMIFVPGAIALFGAWKARHAQPA